MGLDILVFFDNNDEIYSSDYHDEKLGHFHKHSLSRTFCNLMCRKDAVSGEPELDQIGRITSVDISPIYEMENYGHGEELEFFLETAETEEQRQKILNLDKASKEKLKGNIDKVIVTVAKLIDKLSQIDNLPDLLNDNGWDSLQNQIYFADFNKDKGQGYISNNFGQDLRNLKRFLEYAKAKDSTTAYFNYG
jgi:hypothetical protein